MHTEEELLKAPISELVRLDEWLDKLDSASNASAPTNASKTA
jgi:hypothetical protein